MVSEHTRKRVERFRQAIVQANCLQYRHFLPLIILDGVPKISMYAFSNVIYNVHLQHIGLPLHLPFAL